jgi:hypothetical protein
MAITRISSPRTVAVTAAEEEAGCWAGCWTSGCWAGCWAEAESSAYDYSRLTPEARTTSQS